MTHPAHPWMACVSPGDGAIDIGANVGAIARHLAACVGPTGSVLAVEPDPRAIAGLRRTLQPCPWVTVLESAVTDRVGVGCLYLSAKSPQNSLWEVNTVKLDGTQRVTTTTVDALAAQIPNLKAIKIDAQGAECRIMQGARETLQRPGLTWFVEFWPEGLRAAGGSIEDLAAYFDEHGYHPHEREWHDLLPDIAKKKGHGAVDVWITQR